MTLLNKFSLLSVLTGLLIVAGCAQQQQQQAKQEKDTEPAHTKAVAVVNGEGLQGTVTFEKVEDGVLVNADVEGLEQGRHGFHIHQYGDCSAGDFTSAGGHYNPTGNNHGAPTADDRHVGDMGNLPADGEGVATLEYTDPMIKLNGENSVIGRAVIIHSGQDDFESQPSGAAGARIGCGVIGIGSTGE